MFPNLLSDLRAAGRSALKEPGLHLVAAGTLALGIGATTAMFALVHAAFLKPLPYHEPERLVLARRTVADTILMWSSAPDYYDYRERTDVFETLARVSASARRVTIAGAAQPERVPATMVSDDLFTMIGISPVAGRTFTEDEGRTGAPYVVMVSERLARRRFGHVGAAVGRTVSLTGLAPQRVAATIVGVMPDTFRFIDTVDLWGVIRRGENDGPLTRHFHNWIVVGRLKGGVSIAAAQQQVDVISKRLQQLYPATNKTKGLRLDPLQAALLQPQRPRVMLLVGAIVLLLSIACANVAGLLLARGAARRSEFAVRAALGASRGRLAGQLLAESVALAMAGGVAGVALAVWLQRLLPIATGLGASGLSASGLNWTVLVFALAVSILTGVIAGVAPAARAGGYRTAADLAPGARSTDSREGTRLRTLLVVVQVAVSIVLLVGAGLLVRSFVNLTRVDLGFDPRNVLTGQIAVPYPDSDRRIQFFTGLRDDVAAIPGVASVSVTSHVPVRDPAGDPPVWAAGRPPVDSSQSQSAALRLVLPGFFDTLRIPIVAGRDLSERDRRDSTYVVVINRAMARRLFPGEDPLGRRVMMATGAATPAALEVVGVAADARIYGVGQRAPMTMYVSVRQLPPMGLNLVARTELDPQLLAETVRKIVGARDRDVAIESLRPLEETIADSLTPERVTTVTLVLFSGVALLLASLGLYGVLAYHVTQRTHEIGVRMALGAGARDVLAQVLARSGLMVMPGLVLGLACALAGTRLMSRMLYEVAPTDSLAIAVATATLAVVALAASALPAWRAARVNPMQALRGE